MTYDSQDKVEALGCVDAALLGEGIVVISGSVMQPAFVALGIYMVLGMFRIVLNIVVFWLSWQVRKPNRTCYKKL